MIRSLIYDSECQLKANFKNNLTKKTRKWASTMTVMVAVEEGAEEDVAAPIVRIKLNSHAVGIFSFKWCF